MKQEDALVLFREIGENPCHTAFSVDDSFTREEDFAEKVNKYP